MSEPVQATEITEPAAQSEVMLESVVIPESAAIPEQIVLPVPLDKTTEPADLTLDASASVVTDLLPTVEVTEPAETAAQTEATPLQSEVIIAPTETPIAPTEAQTVPTETQIVPTETTPAQLAAPAKKSWGREYITQKIEKLQALRNTRLAEITTAIQKGDAVTIKELRNRYHVTRQTAYGYMRELVKKALAVRRKVISFVKPESK